MRAIDVDFQGFLDVIFFNIFKDLNFFLDFSEASIGFCKKYFRDIRSYRREFYSNFLKDIFKVLVNHGYGFFRYFFGTVEHREFLRTSNGFKNKTIFKEIQSHHCGVLKG